MNDTIMKLLHELKKHYGKLSIVMVSIACISASMLSFGHTLKMLIDHGISSRNIDELNRSMLYMVVTILVLAIASFFRSFYINNISSQVIADIRIRVYKTLLNQPIEYFDKIQISDCNSRFSHDLVLIGDIITNILSFTLRNMFMIIGGMIMMFVQNIKLSLITILILPSTLVLIKIIGKKVRSLSSQLHAEKASIEEIIGETLSNIRIVYAFNVQEYRISKLLAQSTKSDFLNNSYLKLRAFFFAMSISIVTSLLLIVIWIGGVDVLDGTISSGSMVSFLFFAISTALAIGGVAEIFGDMQKYLAAAERVFELEKTDKKPLKETKEASLSSPLSFSLYVEKFAYPSRPDIEIIKKISLYAKAGEFIGIAGPSGSGKSTILQVMMGIYRPEICKLSINGQEQNIAYNEFLRTKIAYVPQEPFLFSTTIEENIKLGRDSGSLDDVIEICGLAETLKLLPNGIKTYVGEKGAQLSGGQKQRISLARSLYSAPEILVLDEATSALDIESENNLLRHVRKFMKGKIIISVAHRLSSIVNADKIFLIYAGEVVGEESHAKLLEISELYRGLVRV